MNYKIRAYDKKSKVWLEPVTLFLSKGKIISVQTHAGIFDVSRFEIIVEDGECIRLPGEKKL